MGGIGDRAGASHPLDHPLLLACTLPLSFVLHTHHHQREWYHEVARINLRIPSPFHLRSAP